MHARAGRSGQPARRPPRGIQACASPGVVGISQPATHLGPQRQGVVDFPPLHVPMLCMGSGVASLDAVGIEIAAHHADAACHVGTHGGRRLPALGMESSGLGTLYVGRHGDPTVGRGRHGVLAALGGSRRMACGEGALEMCRAGRSLARLVVDEDHPLGACRWDRWERRSPSPPQRPSASGKATLGRRDPTNS